MTIRTEIALPLDKQIVDENGQITQQWVAAVDTIFRAVSILRDASILMDTLSTSSTSAEIATAWEEFRTKLQVIT